MKRIDKLILIGLISFFSLNSIAQDYVMTNGGSISVCSGNFLDPGGNGNYPGVSSNTTWTYTICNPTPGQPIYLNFNSLNLWSASGLCTGADKIKLYDGPNTSSLLIGTFTSSPGSVPGNSGCITIEFIRQKQGGLFCGSSSGGDSGWSASISCVAPPPPTPDGTTCFTANPFCTVNTYIFPNQTGNSAPNGPDYGCLSTTPNPVWYYMKIDQSGSIKLNVQQNNGSGNGIDVDFALWGPYNSLSVGCSDVMSGNAYPIQCSYSTAAQETIGLGLQGGSNDVSNPSPPGQTTPPSAISGQYYIVLLTNYANQSGTITFNQIGGTGSCDCAIVNPVCSILGVSATPTACDPSDNSFALSGQVSFANAPTTGTLTVTNTCGGSQTFNAPFTSPINYSIPSLTSNGGACSVTALFSADVACTFTTNYTAPAPCQTCTVTASNSGSVCIGGTFDLSASTVAGATSYAWSGPGGFVSNVQNPTNVPAVSGVYTVNVISGAGNCTATTNFTANPLPTISAGSDVSICVGSNTNLSATGGVSYSWDNTLGAGTSFTVNPPVTTTYTVIGTDANGCVNSDQVVVSVNNLPTIDAGLPITICTGQSTTLNGSGGVSYSWDNGITNGTAFNPSATNTYTVIGTDANGCVGTDQVLVTVNTLPIVDAGSPVAICPGQAITLNGSGAVNYSWDNGVSNGVSFMPSGTGTYTVTGTDANNCTNSDQVTVTVNALPTITASAAPASICQGQSTVLTANGGSTYTWDNGLGAGNNFNASPSSTTTYNVSGTDANGCVNTAQVTVTVNPNVPVNAGVDQAVCAGQSVTLSGSGTSTYSWNNGITNGTPFTPSSTTTYTVSGTSANGCVTTDQVTVTVNPLPTINAGADQTVCIGQNVTLSGSNGQTYTWDNGVTNGNSFTAGVTTIYTVTGTDANGCVDTDQVTVTVLPLPIADVSSDVTDGQVALTVNFYNNSLNSNGYSWDFGIGTPINVSTTNDQQFIYNNPGTYNVVLTASNGLCSDTAMLTITVIPLPPPVITPPNIFTPNGDGANDQYFMVYENLASIEVYIQNRWGNEMFEYKTLNGFWDGKVNGKEAEEGVYFYKYKAKGINGDELTGHGFFHLER